MRHQVEVPSAAALIVAVVLATPPAAAEPRDPAAAEWLFREGRTLMKKRDFLGACPKLEESLRLDPAVGTLMNLAECEERIGRTASAWQRWGAAADELPARDKRRETAIAHARALEKELARLVIELGPGAPANARVERDGILLGEASLGVALPVDPGLHWIVVTAAGREGRELQVRLDPGQQQVVEVEPGAPTPPPRVLPRPTGFYARPIAPLGPPAEAVLDERPPPAARRRGYLVTAAGLAALGAGTFFAVQAVRARSEARDDCVDVAGAQRCWATAAPAIDRDRRASLLADVGFGAGAVATVAGVYMMFHRPSPRAVLVPVTGGGEVQLGGSF
jgi:hypothetical protein